VDDSFDWDATNRRHVARHGVRPGEVEQVFANDPMYLRAEVVDGEERFTAVGHTDHLRILILAWTMQGKTIRPITAFDASKKMQKRYLSEKRLL
jgi:uncharacterized DUF497 family protein